MRSRLATMRPRGWLQLPYSFLIVSVVLPLLIVCQETNEGCRFEMWVFDTIDRCEGREEPTAKGFIYADGQCNTIETDLSTSDSNYRFLPGSYSAYCTSDGTKIHFVESGCLDDQCTSLVVGNDSCDRDNSIEASLFSRLDPPEYPVQDPDNAVKPGFYSCSRVTGDITVTTTIYGDCSLCDPNAGDDNYGDDSTGGGDDGDDFTPPAPVQTPAPTRRPIPPPTKTPVVVIEETDSPSPPPTQRPVEEPVETEFPTTKEPTPRPATRMPLSLEPTDSETNVPSASSTDVVSNNTNVPSAFSSLVPSSSSFAPSLSNTSEGRRTENITVIMVLSKISEFISGGAIIAWENVTTTHVRESAGDAIVNVGTRNIYQTLVDDNGDVISEDSPLSVASQNDEENRLLQSAVSTSISIMFDLYIAFSASSPDTLTAASVFREAFDTESKRTQYLVTLVQTGHTLFKSINVLQIVDDGSGSSTSTVSPVAQIPATEKPVPTDSPLAKPPSPTGPATTNEAANVRPAKKDSKSSSNNNASLGILIGATIASIMLLVACGLLLYRRGKKDALSEKDEMTKDGQPPRSVSDSYYNHNSRIDPHWTNEILVDPLNDDVSTLGGSILAGLHLVDGRPTVGDDEHTASVNIDYDFSKNQYRTGATIMDEGTIDEIRSSDKTNPTTMTSFSKTSNLGDGMLDDDGSFERQFTNTDDENDEKMSHSNHRSYSFGAKSMRLKPFEVQAPPGMLGMVIDTPGGGVPIVRAIKSTSVLYGHILIGDRLTAVDYEDVTAMSAIQVSSLISAKSHQHRILTFVRPRPEMATQTLTTTT